MDLRTVAEQLCEYLDSIKEVNGSKIYGSIASNSFDEYSDIDIEIDVSGIDNSRFITELPEIISRRYDVIFADYAPSLAPQKYVVSLAISSDNPFLIVDICASATPHYTTLSKSDLLSLNNSYEHILKLFAANLKHFIRGVDCRDDIQKIFSRVLADSSEIADENEMLNAVYRWIKDNADSKYDGYLNSIGKYL